VEIKQLFFKEKDQNKNGTATKVKSKPFCSRISMSRNIKHVLSEIFCKQSLLVAICHPGQSISLWIYCIHRFVPSLHLT